MLIEAARVPEQFSDPTSGAISERMVPAFAHEYQFSKGRRYGVITAHPVLREMFSKDSIVSIMTPRHLPMLVPPRPWLTYNSGGYLTKDEPCMRFKDNREQLRLLVQASNEDRLCTLLSGLDALGQTRWAINHGIFAAVSKVWNSGIALAEIPAIHIDIPEPEKPANFETDKKAKLEYYAKRNEWKNKRVNQHSMRCDCNYKVEIAKAFLNHPMYFPHNIDFRGRAYPIPPHFNHLGNDLCRGLLTFHEGRPLTKRGLFWLKIHLANLVGKDKLSHQERLEFIEAHEKEILASADDPVPDSLINQDPNAPRPWWVDSENPWQTLAACIDYAAAIRSPNPEEYVSHLHIHQDGTCNGLQHYAAMGRDTKGAKEVNLMPSDSPQDVYAGILNAVIRLMDKDCKDGVEQALALQNKLTRKIVKQTVMTNVYGVTLMGARDQIAARLREVTDDEGKPAFAFLEHSKLAMYVARKIFESLGEMFTQAQQIQNWLNESARRIAKSMPASALAEWKQRAMKDKEAKEKLAAAKRKAKQDGSELDVDTILKIRPDVGPGSMRRKRMDKLSTKPMATVTWTTPVGLTVTQPYRKFAQRLVNTQMQSISVYDRHMPSPVNSQKQKTAFPPNFVHSLDASHMIL
ncbi:DNA-directed RNA polymerase, partial [Coemansia sp. RSA 2559]